MADGQRANDRVRKMARILFYKEPMKMTTEEFREQAEKLGFSQWEINGQIDLHEKFLREGLSPVPYETVLEARKSSSCLELFERHNADRGRAVQPSAK